MKRIILIIGIAVAIVAFLSSCSMFQEPEYKIDPRLQSSLQAFKNEANKRGYYINGNLILRIGSINSTGLCTKKKLTGQKIITINESLFNGNQCKVDSLALTYIVFHEFGHYMGRGHNKTYSIMNIDEQIKYAGDWHNDIIKREQLLNELFSSIE